MVEAFQHFTYLDLVGRKRNSHNWCPLCHQWGSCQVKIHFPFPVACGAGSVYSLHYLGTVSFPVPSIHWVNEFAKKMGSLCLCYYFKVTMKLCPSVGTGFPLGFWLYYFLEYQAQERDSLQKVFLYNIRSSFVLINGGFLQTNISRYSHI